MECIIDGYDFFNMEPQKYYSPSTSWSPEKKKENAVNKIFSNLWWGARKVDGIFYLFCKDMDGNMYFRPRSKNVKKEYVNKIDWVPHLHSFFEEVDNGTCFIGELYLPRDEQAKISTSIMNCLQAKSVARQQKEEDKLHYYIFDVLAENGKSYLNMRAEDRFDLLNSFARAYPENYVEWAEYKNGKELWDLLQQLLADGYEGVVITRDDAPYQPGKRPSKDCLKVKKELQDNVDCIIIGAASPTKQYTGKEIEVWPYWFNELTNEKITATDYLNQTHNTIYKAYVEGAPVMPVTKNWFYGWAGSLRLGAYKDGKLVEIGTLSGITDDMKERWKDYVGKVCEVAAMEITENQQGGKGLRHPKYMGIRDDVDPKDCTWERIFEG